MLLQYCCAFCRSLWLLRQEYVRHVRNMCKRCMGSRYLARPHCGMALPLAVSKLVSVTTVVVNQALLAQERNSRDG